VFLDFARAKVESIQPDSRAISGWKTRSVFLLESSPVAPSTRVILSILDGRDEVSPNLRRHAD
jgi:hypothetical protein